MQALQMRGIHRLERTELPVPSPGPLEALVRTTATTICTSDLHDLATNPFHIRLPRILGHEAAGVVAAVGVEVHDLAVGTRVAVHPVVPCGSCPECRRGFHHLCARMGHLGYDRDGTFAEFFVQRADRVRPLPGDVPASQGALLEPVAVCLQALARAGDLRHRDLLIVGDGPFGQILARLAARRAGARRLLVSGREPFRLDRLRGIETTTSTIQSSTFDAAILAVSSTQACRDCLASLRPRGRLVVFSALHEPPALDWFALHLKELEIVGSCNDEDRLDNAMDCLKAPEYALNEIVTHEVPFADWTEAFALARDGHDRALKVALLFPEVP